MWLMHVATWIMAQLYFLQSNYSWSSGKTDDLWKRNNIQDFLKTLCCKATRNTCTIISKDPVVIVEIIPVLRIVPVSFGRIYDLRCVNIYIRTYSIMRDILSYITVGSEIMVKDVKIWNRFRAGKEIGENPESCKLETAWTTIFFDLVSLAIARLRICCSCI
jgi:hypothetical protein